jgi:hypothetical protein
MARFRTAVLADTGLQQELLATTDRARFVALVVERARVLGCDLDPTEVEHALRESRIAWAQRWI